MKLALRVLFVVILTATVFSLPVILALNIQREQGQTIPVNSSQFPVTVDPRNKTISESAAVNAFFENASSPLQAAVWNVENIFVNIFDWIVVAVADTSLYQNLAGAAGSDTRLVVITAGMRKEQVADAFAKTFAWNTAQKKEFLAPSAGESLPFIEGSFSPGIYAVTAGASPREAQALVNERFTKDVLSHYGPETEKVVSLDQTLKIASLIEREAGGPDDMRIISGIIWNRLFTNMNLQLDATLQYAKANTASATSWWPRVSPRDMYRKSPYNTYINPGLPPTPIANPSVASVLAALNPKNTDCLFYFHDSAGRFHCSETYAGHVSLLKKYFGRGK